MDEKNLKRRHETLEESETGPPTSKKQCFDVQRELLDLSDDVLLFIFRHLNSSDLLNLSEVCNQRLQRVSSDESLWKKVNTIESPLTPMRFRKLLKFVTRKTSVVRIGGLMNSENLTPSILECLADKCPMLEELTLERCLINAER